MSYREILRQYWGYDSFRGIQEEIIESIGSGRDTLGLMPTGGGKSVTFQVPALAREGICIVVTPLVALMKDQVQNLRRRGIKAAAIYSGMSRQEIIITLENCIFGGFKFLYISPERIASEIFLTKLRSMRVNMLTIDESHCISQWGYDFRPAYLKIADIRQHLPGVPVLALTATATPEVVDDIQEKLQFSEKNVFRMSFERQNLAYVVRRVEDKQGEMVRILKRMEGSAIVYARSRRNTKEIAAILNGEGICANFYHAGLDNAVKDLRQRAWQNDECRVMVATNAFGMGIDKPDVRIVIHMDVPDSPEAYFQEAGRAGRDGERAYAVLLYADGDKRKLHKRVAETFPERDYIKSVYEHVQYYYQMAMGDGQDCVKEFNLEDFCQRFGHFPVQANSALRIIDQAGYLEYTDEQDNASRIIFLIRRDELYRLRDENPNTEMLMQLIMRSYTGIFTDYVFISEDALMTKSGLSRQQIYAILISLSKRGVIHYVPHKKTPYIIYTRERVPVDELYISHEVYEDKKERYVRRIEAMIEYASSEGMCRSRLLLRYFGERNEHDCGQCDVCLARRRRLRSNEGEFQTMADEVRRMVEAEPLSPLQLRDRFPEREPELDAVVSYLLSEGVIEVVDGVYVMRH
jgi:ATP-dependent DNA helicase RecQ